MKKIIFYKSLTALCFSFLFMNFFSCATLKDDVQVSTEDSLEEDAMTLLEKRVCELDAQTFMGMPSDSSGANLTRLLEDAKAASSSVQKAQYAKLQALQGRIYLMEGKRKKAKECYTDSVNTYKGEVQGVILANRLSLVHSLDEEAAKLSTSRDKALLTLEKALQAYGENQYAASLSLFDTAFISLPAFYKNAYKDIRAKAWEYRKITGSEKAGTDLLKKSTVTVGELLVIACEENEKLQSLLGGSTASQNTLYRKACALGFLSSVTEESSLPLENDFCSKVLAARFFWNVHAYLTGMENSAPYTEKLSKRKASPFQDLPFGNADFDAVMGCVENEYLNLKDGIHFEPESSVSALLLSEAAKKLR